MPDSLAPDSAAREWPQQDGCKRVPYWVFHDEDMAGLERSRLFQGPTWNFLCLEVEVPRAGDFVACHVGETPVIVTRDADGELYAFENRCSHRGSLLALEDRGNVKDFTCVYHAWSHSLQGDLIDIAFKDGIKGRGGIASEFCMADHPGPRKLRVASVHGLVFGSFDDDVDDFEDYVGPAVMKRIGRVLGGRKPVVLGRFTQVLPNNWKLYVENTKDSYHASILHTFFTTFELNRLSQKGGIIVSENGGSHVSYSEIDRAAEVEKKSDVYAEQKIRSQSDLALSDTSLLSNFKEFDDDITLQILSVFPNFVLQQIQNALAVRTILPKGTDKMHLKWTYLGFENDTPEERRMRMKLGNLVGPGGYVSMEDGCIGGFVARGAAGSPGEKAILAMGGYGTDTSDDRITEAAIRGFWLEYRRRMGL